MMGVDLRVHISFVALLALAIGYSVALTGGVARGVGLWMALLFAGKMLVPSRLNSEAEMVEYVANHATAIGYVHKATPHKGVAVLTVQ